jgi:hypothetical protein
MRCKPSLPAVAHPRAAHADRTDAGHDLALWQMAVAHQPLAAIIGRLVVGVPTEQGRDLGLDSFCTEIWHAFIRKTRRLSSAKPNATQPHERCDPDLPDLPKVL